MWQNQRIYSAVNLYRSHCTWLAKSSNKMGVSVMPGGVARAIFLPGRKSGKTPISECKSVGKASRTKNYSFSWFFAAFYIQPNSYIFRLTDCGDFGETFEPVPKGFLANLLSARVFTRLGKCSSPLQSDCVHNWQIYGLRRMIYAEER